MASSSASLCSSIYTSNCFPANPIYTNYCNRTPFLYTKRRSEQKYSLNLQTQEKNNNQYKRHFNVHAASASPLQLPATPGDLRVSAPFPSTPPTRDLGYNSIRAAKKGNPPVVPGIMTPAGPLDLMSVLLRSRIVFIGQPINAQVAQRVISQLMTLAAIDPDADILMYLNCPGGSIYSILAIYDCMSWIKPKVGTVCFGVAASQAALLLAGGEKGMRYAMPNSRIMIHQPQGGCGGTIEDVWRQVNELVSSRDKLDKMYVAFTGQPLENVQRFTDRDYFFSAAEAMEFGLIDGVLETEY